MEQGLCRILNLILLFARKIVPGSKANSLINEPFYPLINNFHPISFPIIRPWICQLMIHSGWCYWKGVNEVGDMIIRGIRDHIRIACMLFFIPVVVYSTIRPHMSWEIWFFLPLTFPLPWARSWRITVSKWMSREVWRGEIYEGYVMMRNKGKDM